MSSSSPTLSEKEKTSIDLEVRSCVTPTLSFSDRLSSDSSGRYVFHALGRSLSDGTLATCPSNVEAKGCQLGLSSLSSLSSLLALPSCRIQSLSLEWNTLGTYEVPFADFCNALSLNPFLKVLDLRNNAISPSGCVALCRALRNNRSTSVLGTLDLRWNDVGNVGALAVKELLLLLTQGGTNGTTTMLLKDVRLAGNKVGDTIAKDVEELVRNRTAATTTDEDYDGATTTTRTAAQHRGESAGAAMMTMQGGRASDAANAVLQLQNEELMSEIVKLSSELQVQKEETRKKESAHVFDKSKVKSELEAKLESLENQLLDSAAAVNVFEIELLRERERVARLQDTLAFEHKEKDALLSTARVEKETVASRKVASDREKTQLSTTVRITEETLDALRKEEDNLRRVFADREKELLTQLSGRERNLADARRGEDKAKAEQSRVEVALGDAKLREKMAEERALQCAKLLDDCTEDRARRVEEARESAQEITDKARTEMGARVKAAEARASDAEKRLSDSEMQRRMAESRAAAASVIMEQKLSDQAVKLRGELGSLQDGEVRELTGSLDVMRAQRESQDIAISQLMADLESLRDLREKESESAKATFERINKSLSEALTEARKERGQASDLRLEVASLKRQLDPFKRRVETAEAEKKRSEEFRQRDIEQLQSLVAKEREDRARECVSYQKRLDECNELLRTAREGLSEQRTAQLKEFHKLEKGMVAAVQAIFTDRRMKSFGASGEEGKAAKKKGGKENEVVDNV